MTSRITRPAFTLLELMIALAVVAVLATAVLPGLKGRLDTGKLQATAASLNGLAEAVRQYRATTGAWPALWTDLSSRYLPSPTPTTAWGDAITLSSAGSLGQVTAPVPLTSPPTGLLPPLGTSAAVPGTQWTAPVPIPGETADLALERNRLSGSTGF